MLSSNSRVLSATGSLPLTLLPASTIGCRRMSSPSGPEMFCLPQAQAFDVTAASSEPYRVSVALPAFELCSTDFIPG
jgi:hypothetical protein